MGVAEHGGKVASNLIEALRNQPLILALVVTNVLFIALAAWLFSASAARRDELITKLATKIATCQCPRPTLE